MGELVPRHPGNRFTVCSSARLQKSTGNPDCHASISRLSGDEEHDPAEHDGRDGEEHEAVDAVADHAPGRVALGDAEDGGSKEGEEDHRDNMRGPEHQCFLPVRRLWASTAAMTLSRPATTMKRVP